MKFFSTLASGKKRFSDSAIQRFAIFLLLIYLLTPLPVYSQYSCFLTDSIQQNENGGRSDCRKFELGVNEILALPDATFKVVFHFKANSNNQNFSCDSNDPAVIQNQFLYAPTTVSYVLNEMNLRMSTGRLTSSGSSSMKINFILSDQGNCSPGIFIYNYNQSFVDVPDAINIRFENEPTGPNGGWTSFGGRIIWVNNVYTQFSQGNTYFWDVARLINHEFGHTRYLHHAFYCGNPCNGTDIDSDHECCGSCVNQPYNGPGCFNCSNRELTMSYGSQIYFTECEFTELWNYMINNPRPYQLLDLCESTTSTGPIVFEDVNNVILWNQNKIFKNNVVIKSGTTVEVNCTVQMEGNKHIIVERGANLIVNGGTMTSLCPENKWQGIIVEGNASGSQTLAGKVELKNNAVIDNAKNGISMNPTYLGWPAMQDYWGGLVEASYSNFSNCGRAVEFMKYGVNSTADNSFFEHCTFLNCTTGITAWSNNGVSVSDCNFTNINHAIGPYDSQMNISENVFTNVTIGVDITSTTTLPYATSITDNTIQANDYGVYATASANANRLNIVNNSIIGGNLAGVKLDGVSHFEIQNNDFLGQNLGTHLFGTELGTNDDIKLNNFSSNNLSNLNNFKNDVLYDHNCYQYNGKDIEVNTGSIHPFQRPNTFLEAGNCFSKGGVPDITAINNDHFEYFIKDNTIDCKVPITPGNYTVTYDNSAIEGLGTCGSELPGSGAVNIIFRRCVIPKTEAAALQMKAQLEQEILNLQSNQVLSPELIAFLIARYKACLKKIERDIIIIIKDDEGNNRNGRRNQAIAYAKTAQYFENQAIGLGMLIEESRYPEALQYLSEMTATTSEQIDFKLVQEINIDFRQNMYGYTLSNVDQSSLLSIGNETSPLSGYARGLYYTITGIRIPTNPIQSGNNPTPRNSSTSLDEVNIRAYPNPVQNNQYFIAFDGNKTEDAIFNIRVINQHGEVLFDQKSDGSKTITLDVSGFSSGVYFLNINNQKNQLFRDKFVVIK